MVADIALPKDREIANVELRAIHPMAGIESCASASELDFLWRFLEASDFVAGHVRVYDDEGEPMGRYADHAERMDAQAYVKFEVSAYNWVRRFSMGKEWATIAEMFVRMLSGRTESSFVDWGSFLTNSDDEKISYGGAQVSMRMLALRLKDAYRDFFRWYETVKKAEEQGQKVTPRDALRELERDARYQRWIEEFKQDRGVPG
jgi:hypothetical protein